MYDSLIKILLGAMILWCILIILISIPVITIITLLIWVVGLIFELIETHRSIYDKV